MSACLVALDFDGTLSPLVRHPARARLPAKTRRLLLGLSRRPGVRLAFISGRSLRDVSSRMGLRGVFYSGNHGLEIRGPGLSWRHPKARTFAADIRAAGRALARQAREFPGALVEDKGLTLSLHYRRMDPRRLPGLRRAVRRALAPFARRLALSEGKKTFELRPRADWNKGHALLKIARSARAGRRVVFVGDDRTDEDGFRLLGARALTVKVGPGATAARFRAARQEDVARLLKLILMEVS